MEKFMEYLSRQQKAAEEKITELEREGRRAEADFEKVRKNIYEICSTVTNALKGRPGAGLSAVEAHFERFRSQWSAALEKAQKDHDERNTVIGETRMAALEDVIVRFREIQS